MTAVKYRIMFSGDIHLCSRNYGGHNNYPQESLHYFKRLNEIAKENNITHDIRLGDFTYGKFNDLQYRTDIEKELKKAKEQVNGNLYILKGNHDISSTGMTEYEFYLNAKWFNGSTNITIDNVNINMLNYGDIEKPIIEPSKNSIDIIVGHDYYKFSDTQLPNYGNAIEIDNKIKWFGVDLILLGHIHNFHKFKGVIVKDGVGHPTVVEYLNCPCRPSYQEGLDEDWHLFFLDIMQDGTVKVNEYTEPLLNISECFNFDKMQTKKEVEEQKRIDLSDIIQRVGNYTSMTGDPEIVIQNMTDVEEKYKQKALELLREDK